MNFKATVANSLWFVASVPASRRFASTLANPDAVQRRKLRSYLERHANTAFGRAHRFEGIRSYEEFTRRVPLRGYDELAPWIERVRAGEQKVLTNGRVTRLMPTSGTTSGRKLIPMTADLQSEFSAAVGAWFVDLCRQEPSLHGGRAYWSVTPTIASAQERNSKVPVGFDPDTAYLNRALARLIESTMAVPQAVALARTIEAFRYTTVLALLRCGDLRFISIWHPSFLTLLLDTLAARWQELLDDVRHGTCVHSREFPAEAGRAALARPNTRRAKELSGIAASDLPRIWPQLKIVSCWGDGPSAIALENLRSHLPRVHIQPKGLIATEAIVSIPFRGQRPLALDSHFFEFIGSDGAVRLASDLSLGEEYEVIVTTGGGLWRYKLGDRIKVTGFVGRTPSIQFLSRSGIVSDQCGEKVSEGFVAQAFALAFGGSKTARFALLAPDENTGAVSYTLYLEGECPPSLVARLESALCANPHYAYCRKLGQLQSLRLFSIRSGGYEAFVKRQAAGGVRIGDVKPAMLSRATGWSQIFDGAYACQ